MSGIETQWAAIRQFLRENGEPCGSPRNQCPNSDIVHMQYYELPTEQKDLMVMEREDERESGQTIDSKGQTK